MLIKHIRIVQAFLESRISDTPNIRPSTRKSFTVKQVAYRQLNDRMRLLKLF